ncbi:MAG TPA: NAD-dependent epimerase/dehydratase family protein [Candidatus Paceibacterota bacterium]
MAHTVLITGAAGYVGFMLVERLAKRADVACVYALDKEEMPDTFASYPKIRYIQKNTSEDWERDVDQIPDIIIHAAWQIRDLYGRYATQWKWNIEGSDRVFDFALRSAVRLIYFSTVASYGAYADNAIEQRFTERDLLRPSDYRYAEEKRISELHLKEKYNTVAVEKRPAVCVVRPAAITGPQGRFARIRFGLQSALSGQLKGSFIYGIVSTLASFVPATPKWARQFVHEDDVVDIIELLTFDKRVQGYEIFNLCPPGSPVLAADMARAVGKRIVRVHPQLVRLVFFVLHHATLGKIPTARGAWKGYSYPILVVGNKITEQLGYRYSASSAEAFMYTDGHYEVAVPKSVRRHKPL